MEAFTTLTAVAAPYPGANVDTDKIIPHRFLRKPLSDGYRNFLFHDERLDGSGAEQPDFVLHKPAYRSAGILVVGRNFGCGSAREGAVYALRDWGIRALIGPGYADTFRVNCLQNGVLPVVLDEAVVASILQTVDEAPGAALEIDLPGQRVRLPDGTTCTFDIEAGRKEQLLLGLDDIGLTQRRAEAIEGYKLRYYGRLTWLAGG